MRECTCLRSEGSSGGQGIVVMHLRTCRNLLWLLMLVGVVACHYDSGSGSVASGAGVSAASAAATPFAIQDVRIGVGVEAGLHARLMPVTTRDPVTAMLVTTGHPNGVQLSARLMCLKTGKDAGKIAMRLDAKSVTTPIALHFPADADQVPGRYTLEIRLDGRLAAKRYFDVAPAMASATPSSASH